MEERAIKIKDASTFLLRAFTVLDNHFSATQT
jgi:hypothetical protein